MSTKTIFLAASAAVALCSVAPVQAYQTSDELLIFSLINQERIARGLQPLKINEKLTEAARAHAQDMHSNHYFSHLSQDGRNALQRASEVGYLQFECHCTNWSISVNENIAKGQNTPQAAVQGWLNSPGHRHLLLSSHPNETGIGVVGRTWVQLFGKITVH